MAAGCPQQRHGNSFHRWRGSPPAPTDYFPIIPGVAGLFPLDGSATSDTGSSTPCQFVTGYLGSFYEHTLVRVPPQIPSTPHSQYGTSAFGRHSIPGFM